MEDKKVVVTLYMWVYCSSEYHEGPCACTISLTAEDIQRIKKVQEAVLEYNLTEASFIFEAEWFAIRPIKTFDELGEKFIVDFDEYEFDDMGDNIIPDETLQYSEMRITATGFYATVNGKHSGNFFESRVCSIKSIEELIAQEGNTPRENYYFFDKESIPSLEDLPKMLNESDARSTYAREKLKQGV